MKQFNSMLEAAEFAATFTDGWRFAYSEDTYTKANLLTLAQTSDEENPIDEDNFYVVSPSGDIGLCEDGEDIDWLFLVNPDRGQILPSAFTTQQINFCPKCGNGMVPGAQFCDECGAEMKHINGGEREV